MFGFPLCGISDDDFPPGLKDFLGNKPLETFTEMIDVIDGKKKVPLNRLKDIRNIIKHLNAINAKHCKGEQLKNAIADGEETLEQINTLIYDAERNI